MTMVDNSYTEKKTLAFIKHQTYKYSQLKDMFYHVVSILRNSNIMRIGKKIADNLLL